jgi:hypothetical protein
MIRTLLLSAVLALLGAQFAFAQGDNPCNPCAVDNPCSANEPADNPCAVEEVPANPCDTEATKEAEPAPAGPVYDPTMPLNEQFATMRLAFMASLPDDMQAFFTDQQQRISAKDIPALAVQQGDMAPDLMLVQPGEDPMAFADFVAQGPVILQFYRGNW